MWLAILMVLSLTVEVPNLGSPRFVQHREGIAELAQIVERVAADDVDAALLTSILYFEGRYRLRPKDGDCRPEMVPGTKLWKQQCHAFGPMQLSKGAPHWLPGVDPAFEGLGEKELRDPETNVRAGYGILKRWREQCGGGPGVWLTAYGWGRCPTKGYVDREGKRRCAVATAMLEAAGAKPEGWKCGHEGRPLGKRTESVVERIKQLGRK